MSSESASLMHYAFHQFQLPSLFSFFLHFPHSLSFPWFCESGGGAKPQPSTSTFQADLLADLACLFELAFSPWPSLLR